MSNCGSSGGAAKHRKLVTAAIDSNNAVSMFRKYHEREIDIFTFEGPRQRSDKSILFVAALGRGGVLRLLLELGCDLNAVDINGFHPLQHTTIYGHAETIRVLCELGANIHIRNRDGCSPAYQAAEGGHVETIRLLCELGADINVAAKDGCTPGYAAAGQRHVEAVRALYERGADVNAAIVDGCTPVHAAAQEGHVEAIRTLCELGTNVNTRDKHGYTPVFAMDYHGQEKVVKLLRKLGADINEVSKYGTPLDQAQLGGHTGVAEKLIRYTSQCQCCLQEADDVLLLCGVPEARLEVAQEDVLCCGRQGLKDDASDCIYYASPPPLLLLCNMHVV
jgi:hypothetical protein